MAKSKKGKKGRPNIPPQTLLRPRLDRLLERRELSEQPRQMLFQRLNELAQEVKPSDFLPVLLKAYLEAPESLPEEAVEPALLQWLKQGDRLQELRELVALDALGDPVDRQLALRWLQDAGVEISDLEAFEREAFYQGHLGADSFGSQAVLLYFWYTNSRHNRVRGLGFLIDYNPPWEGSVKEITVYPVRSPEEAASQFVDFWRTREPGIELESLSPEATKTEILAALEQNRQENIRLPRELIALRGLFVRHVLSLPDGPDTPDFLPADFDELAELEQTPESLMAFERTMGRRVRMEDGQEMLVMGDPWSDKEEPW